MSSWSDEESDMVAALYDGVSKGTGWQQFLDLLSGGYAGGRSALALHDPVMRTGGGEAVAGWDESYVVSYNNYYAALNPWQPRMASLAFGVATSADSLVPREELERTEFFHDWMKPQGLGTCLVVVLQRDASRLFSATVLYPRATEEADPDALPRLQRLAPHIMRAAQLNRQLALLETRAASAEFALDAQESAMLIVNAAGEVISQNAVAEKLLGRGEGFRRSGKMAQPVALAEQRIFGQLVAEACRARGQRDARPGGVMRVGRGGGRRALEVLVTPAPAPASSPFVTSLAVVFIRDPEKRPVAPVARLRAFFGLTAAEGRLLAALLGDETIESFSETFSVSKETLRTQLKSIFQKTQTKSQMELVRVCLRGLGASKAPP